MTTTRPVPCYFCHKTTHYQDGKYVSFEDGRSVETTIYQLACMTCYHARRKTAFIDAPKIEDAEKTNG
jgi:hypothetical protein